MRAFARHCHHVGVRSLVFGLVAVVLGALLAAFAYVGSIHEYSRAFGPELAGAYDCDGPASVLMFLVPSFGLAIIGVLLSARAFRANRRVLAAAGIAVGVLVLLLDVARVPPALRELRRNAAPDSPCR